MILILLKKRKKPQSSQFLEFSQNQVQVVDEVQTRGVEKEEREVILAIALLVTVILIFAG